MENNEERPDAERIAADLTSYVNLRLDALKLSLVENLSVAFSNAFGIVVFIILGGMGLLFFTGVLTYLLGLLIGSMLWAVIVMGALFMIAAVVVLVNRQKMFADQMVRMFGRMFFPPKEPGHEE